MSNFTSIKINVSHKIYLRDPEQTQLGRKIINHSIRLIDELGFEAFTFKKLAIRINSTEASIYRYFESKHHLLVYLVSWYWGWLEYQIDYQTHNIASAEQRLRIIIKILVEMLKKESNFSYINESALHRIIISESTKAYHTKNVVLEDENGFFGSYKVLCEKIARVISEINPNYPYPRALASTLLEVGHQQIFFAQYLPVMTEFKVNQDNYISILNYLEELIFRQLR
ncbi:MAG: TetR/AcrR family transcriptional regulator [Microscillaceae bacterium]|nr:TetR/AcrR family transcriptional regulator [Microscillaceae bacterium]MDW8461325.1 TetR/AcrR family transcriptional regulator [Cytophagales bacterium]